MTTTMPQPGQMAPAFSLPDQEGREVSLKDFNGKKNVILYFYPKAMTPGCTVQACKLRDSQQALAANQTVALGIAADSVERLKKFAQKENLNFTLLSDQEQTVIKKYGAWGPKQFMGKKFTGILRITFIIGKDGRIKHIMERVKTKTHHQEALQFITDHLSPSPGDAPSHQSP